MTLVQIKIHVIRSQEMFRLFAFYLISFSIMIGCKVKVRAFYLIMGGDVGACLWWGYVFGEYMIMCILVGWDGWLGRVGVC